MVVDETVKEAFKTRVANYVNFLETTGNTDVSVEWLSELQAMVTYTDKYGEDNGKILKKLLPQM